MKCAQCGHPVWDSDVLRFCVICRKVDLKKLATTKETKT